MLGYLALLLFQIIAAVFGAKFILPHIPLPGDLKTFAHAALFAVIVWVVGVVGSQILKDVRMPGSSTLALALVLALICAAIIVFFPQLLAALPIKFPAIYLALIGALVGYMARR